MKSNRKKKTDETEDEERKKERKKERKQNVWKMKERKNL